MDKSPPNLEEARLLPRLRQRSPQLDRRRMEREQSKVLLDEMEANPDRAIDYGTPGAEDKGWQRMVPVMGITKVSGAIPGTRPDQSSWCAVCGKRCKCEAA